MFFAVSDVLQARAAYPFRATPTAPTTRDILFAANLLRPEVFQDGSGRLPDGLIYAGLIDLGALLGVGSFWGRQRRRNPQLHQLPAPQIELFGETRTGLAANPSSAADMIVSILYKYSKDGLRDFFLGLEFLYIHHYDGENPYRCSNAMTMAPLPSSAWETESSLIDHHPLPPLP